MFIKGIKWLDTKLELTRINIEWSKISVEAQKYHWKPEFLWTKSELEGVIELYERAYELAVKENEIWVITKRFDYAEKTQQTMVDMTRELWSLKQRLSLAA